MSKLKFYEESLEKRRAILREAGKIHEQRASETELAVLNELSENVIGRLSLPLSVVPEVLVNDKLYTVPMATEEPSVVAAANHGVTVFNRAGGAVATSKREGIYGQLLLSIDEDFSEQDFTAVNAAIPDFIERLNRKYASLVQHGGGIRTIEPSLEKGLLELRVLVNPAEAMGANKVNSIMETLAQIMLTKPHVLETQFSILSNYPTQLTTAKVWLPLNLLDKGCTDDELDAKATDKAKKIADKFVTSADFAKKSQLRAPTNNKGIMNGVDSVLLATGNDFRAVEAATHMYASLNGSYETLSNWSIETSRDIDFLVGELTIPLPIGVVGGSISVRPDVWEAYDILGHPSVKELAEVIATIGLANNFAALYALTTSGIQAGHMKLQARNAALAAGATLNELPAILPEILALKEFNSKQVEQIITDFQNKE